MNWNFLKTKTFWTAFLTVVADVIGYILTKNYYPAATVPLEIVVSAVGFILTTIGGTVNGIRLKNLKKQIQNPTSKTK
jgi:hypothetical protein